MYTIPFSFRVFSFLFLPFPFFSRTFFLFCRLFRVARLRVAARGNRPCAKGVATPPRCHRRTTFPSAAFGLRSAWRQVARNKKTTQNRLFGATLRGWCIEHVLSHDSFLHLRENAFLVSCTHAARAFRLFLKDPSSSDAPENFFQLQDEFSEFLLNSEIWMRIQ